MPEFAHADPASHTRLRARRRVRSELLAALAALAVIAALLATADHAEAATGPPIAAPQVTYRAPLVITRGGTYRSAHASTSPDQPAIRVRTTEPVIIDGAAVRGPGDLIVVDVPGANVTVRNTYGEGTGDQVRRFVRFDGGFAVAVVENNDLVATSGMWFHQATPDRVSVQRNRVRNVTGGSSFIQAIQFDKVEMADAVIADNEIVNTPGRSRVEDVISF